MEAFQQWTQRTEDFSWLPPSLLFRNPSTLLHCLFWIDVVGVEDTPPLPVEWEIQHVFRIYIWRSGRECFWTAQDVSNFQVLTQDILLTHSLNHCFVTVEKQHQHEQQGELRTETLHWIWYTPWRLKISRSTIDPRYLEMSMPSGSDMCAMGQLRRFRHRSYLPKPLGWSTPWYHAQHFSPSWLKIHQPERSRNSMDEAWITSAKFAPPFFVRALKTKKTESFRSSNDW